MYTVKELIEALKECPEDYKVQIVIDDWIENINSVSIDPINERVGLFGEDY